MALAATNLATSSSTTDGTSFATASVTPAANSLILIAVAVSVASGTSTAPSGVTGNGITYTQVDQTSTGTRTLHLYRGMSASPTAGAITFATTVAWTSCLWSVVQFTGADTSGTNGSGAIVQSINGKPASGLTPSQSFTTAPQAANGAFGAITTAGTITAATAGSGWTKGGDTNQTAPVGWLTSEYDLAAPSAAITMTFTGTAGNNFAVGCEILPAGAAAAANPLPPRIVQRVPLLRASNF